MDLGSIIDRLSKLERNVEELQEQNRLLIAALGGGGSGGGIGSLENPGEEYDAYIDRFMLLPTEVEDTMLPGLHGSGSVSYVKLFSSVVQCIKDRVGPKCPIVYLPRRGIFGFKEEGGWLPLSQKQWWHVLNRIHLNVFRVFLEWKGTVEIQKRIAESDSFSSLCDTAVIRWMKVDLTKPAVQQGVRTLFQP